MINDIFREYAELKNQIKELEARKATLELQVIDAIDAEGQAEVTNRYGTFASVGRKSWDYTSAIAELTKSLSEAKKVEELTGKATLKKVTSYVRYIPAKADL